MEKGTELGKKRKKLGLSLKGSKKNASGKTAVSKATTQSKNTIVSAFGKSSAKPLITQSSVVDSKAHHHPSSVIVIDDDNKQLSGASATTKMKAQSVKAFSHFATRKVSGKDVMLSNQETSNETCSSLLTDLFPVCEDWKSLEDLPKMSLPFVDDKHTTARVDGIHSNGIKHESKIEIGTKAKDGNSLQERSDMLEYVDLPKPCMACYTRRPPQLITMSSLQNEEDKNNNMNTAKTNMHTGHIPCKTVETTLPSKGTEVFVSTNINSTVEPEPDDFVSMLEDDDIWLDEADNLLSETDKDKEKQAFDTEDWSIKYNDGNIKEKEHVLSSKINKTAQKQHTASSSHTSYSYQFNKFERTDKLAQCHSKTNVSDIIILDDEESKWNKPKERSHTDIEKRKLSINSKANYYQKRPIKQGFEMEAVEGNVGSKNAKDNAASGNVLKKNFTSSTFMKWNESQKTERGFQNKPQLNTSSQPTDRVTNTSNHRSFFDVSPSRIARSASNQRTEQHSSKPDTADFKSQSKSTSSHPNDRASNISNQSKMNNQPRSRLLFGESHSQSAKNAPNWTHGQHTKQENTDDARSQSKSTSSKLNDRASSNGNKTNNQPSRLLFGASLSQSANSTSTWTHKQHTRQQKPDDKCQSKDTRNSGHPFQKSWENKSSTFSTGSDISKHQGRQVNKSGNTSQKSQSGLKSCPICQHKFTIWCKTEEIEKHISSCIGDEDIIDDDDDW